MSVDLSQFYQIFFEEAQEHLDSMEALLLDIDVEQPDPEQLNAIFRAAHSIKGSAGTFGFTDLAEVTHILENLLDRVRKGELALRPDMIDAFLDAGDVLKDLLGAHRGNGSADPAQAKALCQRLATLTGDTPVSGPGAMATTCIAGEPVPALPPAAGWTDVSFVLEQGTQEPEAAIDNLIAELDPGWQISVVDRAASPDARWCLRVGADADLGLLRGMLEFLARSDSIRVDPAGASNSGSMSISSSLRMARTCPGNSPCASVCAAWVWRLRASRIRIPGIITC